MSSLISLKIAYDFSSGSTFLSFPLDFLVVLFVILCGDLEEKDLISTKV